jgi:iron complex outermembrane receptor protein
MSFRIGRHRPAARGRVSRPAAWVSLLTLVGLAKVIAQQPPVDLTELSLESLLNIEVTSVARREQKLSQSASAIYVITQEDIRRSGATTIPDALRMAPGVHVGQMDGNKWIVSIRGFHGRFANKLLVMIDGRSVYSPVFGGVYWEANDLLLEDVDRIEVIRGPGATLWGSNAVNGVINIITRHTRETQGLTASAGGGNQEGGFGSVRLGGQIDSRFRYRFYSKYFSRSGSFLSSGERTPDNWLKTQGGFRIDGEPSVSNSLLLTGDVYEADGGDRQSRALLEPPYQAVTSYRASFSGANLLGRWTHQHSKRSSTQLQAYYDHSMRDDQFIRTTEVNVTDVEVQHQFDLSRHRLVGGVGIRVNQHSQPADWIARYQPRERATHRVNTFLQDEIALVSEKLLLTVGTKLERSTFAGIELQPSASLLWNRSARDTLWMTFARATRSPSRVEHDVVFTAFAAPGPEGSLVAGEVFGNQQIDSEQMLTYGAGYRFTPRSRLSFDLTGFYNVYEGVISTQGGAPFTRAGPPLTTVLPLIFENRFDPAVYGAEAAAGWRVSETADLRLSYSYLGGGLETSADVPGPAHQLHTRCFWRPHRRLEWDNSYLYVDGFSGVAAYHRVDSRIGWQLTPHWEFSLVGQNLLDNQHPETPPILSLAAEVGRSFYGKLSWHLPAR